MKNETSQASRREQGLHDLLYLQHAKPLHKAIFRWRIWTGQALIRSQDGGSWVLQPDGIETLTYKRRVMLITKHLLFAVSGTLALWIVVPFILMWMAGAAVGKNGAFSVLMATMFITLALTLLVLWILSVRQHNERAKQSLDSSRAWIAGLALPILMYLYASLDEAEFKSTAAMPTGLAHLWLWLKFYGYVFLDILSLGSFEYLVGPFDEVQPKSKLATTYNLLLRPLMGVSIAYQIFRYIRRRLFAHEEFAGTFDALLDRIGQTASSGQNCMVRPIAREIPVEPRPTPVLADQMFKYARQQTILEKSPQYKSEARRFFEPGIKQQLTLLVIVLPVLCIAILPISTLPKAILVSALSLAAFTAVVLPALGRARGSARTLLCLTQLRGLGQGIVLFATTHNNRMPLDFEELLEDQPDLEKFMLCPQAAADLNLPEGQRPTRQQLLEWTTYRYHGKGEPLPYDSRIVLIHEQVGTHRPNTINAVFGDLSAKSCTPFELSELQSGVGWTEDEYQPRSQPERK